MKAFATVNGVFTADSALSELRQLLTEKPAHNNFLLAALLRAAAALSSDLAGDEGFADERLVFALTDLEAGLDVRTGPASPEVFDPAVVAELVNVISQCDGKTTVGAFRESFAELIEQLKK